MTGTRPPVPERLTPMKTAFRLIVGFLLIAGWAVAALAMHVVRGLDLADGSDRWLVIPKGRLGIAETYVDVRAWTPHDVGRHPALVKRLIEAGKADLLAATAPVEKRGDLVRFLRETLENPPPPPAAVPTSQPADNDG